MQNNEKKTFKIPETRITRGRPSRLLSPHLAEGTSQLAVWFGREPHPEEYEKERVAPPA